MSTNYSEQIFQAVDTIVSQRLNEVSFDKTEICKIVSEDTSAEGKYWVTNDVLRFEAYSTDPDKSYMEGQKVYVTIPSGDYSMRKIIIGSYSSDEIPKNLYTNPFDHLVASSEISIPTSNLKVTAKKDGTETIKSVTKSGLTFHYSGLGQFNYIGLDFSATTGFGGTIGEFQIMIDLLNSSGTSLLTNEQKGLLTFSSRQLYGNPYYLTSALHFQHLFNFPLEYNNVKFSDLTKVKQIKVTLRSLGNFNYPNTATTTDININSLKLYFGFDSTEDSMSENTVALVLDDPVNNLEYDSATNKKQMSIDWRNLTTNAIYNETDNKQYPTAGEYYVYWLQYSESIGYTKTLETSASDMSKIDIDESGTYWKTVQKKDANQAAAYSYTLKPSEDWKKEQIKVIIKHKDGDYIESKGLTFTNKNFRSETGSNQGSKDTLKLTLAEGDDGIYNSYGIDNKLLSSYNLEHSLTVDYIDNTKWDKDLQKVVWKIPKNATMIKKPEGWVEKDSFYVLEVKHNTSNTDGKTIKFKLSDQFSYNKTNNTIYCEITRYKNKDSGVITDTYQGSITLQFGLQGTAGTGWSFNITSNKRSITSGSGKNTMTLTATLENSNGDPITSDDWKQNIEWSWHQTDGTNTPTLSPNQNKYSATITRKGKDDYYAIVKAVLKNWQDKNGNKINLTAYFPIATGDASYYLTGAARVIYNSQGTTPSHDTTSYGLYNSSHTLVDKNYIYNIISPETNKNNCFTINSKEGNLKPLSFLPTIIPKMAIQVSDTKGNVKYTQPILILKNGYQSTLINEWDGALKIDSNNNTILSSLIGAGKKDSNNLFTGVILGVANNFKLGARTGLYGYQSGEVRFSLDEKGAFYVGQGSDNFISFNEGISGRSGLSELMIKTNKFNLNTPKLQINSSNGIKLLDANGTTTVELKNNGTAAIGGWKVDADRMYKPPTTNNAGTGVSATGYGGNPAFWAGYTGYGNNPWEHSKNRPSGDNSSWSAHTKCYITNNGILYASGANIEGKFTISADSTLNGKTVSAINKSVFETLPNNINAKVSETKDGVTNGTGWSLKSDQFEIYSIKNKKSTTVLTVNQNGMSVTGAITATSLTLGSGVKIPYDDISDQPDLTIYISKGGTIGTVKNGSTGFTVSKAGLLQASNAIIYGTIYSSAGKIANWDIQSDYLGSFGEVANTIFMSKGKAAYVNQTGTSPSCVFYAKGNFAVTTSGKLYCSDVNLSGTLSSSTISGSTVKANYNSTEGAYRTILGSDGTFKYYNGVGYLTCGKASGTYHPWLSGLNVNYANGISFRNGSAWSNCGSEIDWIGHSGSTFKINSGANLNLSGTDVAITSTISSSNYVRANWNYNCAKETKYNNGTEWEYWLSFGHPASSNPPRIKATEWIPSSGSKSFNLYLFSGGGKTYCGGSTEDYYIKTKGATPSSLNVKTNLVSLQEEYEILYEEINKVQAYTFDYKYKNVNGELNSDYGFIIDEIEAQPHLSQYFYNYSTQRAINHGKLEPLDNDNEAQNKMPKLDIKVWDTDSYIKGLFVMVKTLQYKIDQLEQEIKEIKQNEI